MDLIRHNVREKTATNTTLTLTVTAGSEIWLDDYRIDVLDVYPDHRCRIRSADRSTMTFDLDSEVARILPPGAALYTSLPEQAPKSAKAVKLNVFAPSPNLMNGGVVILTGKNKPVKPSQNKSGVAFTSTVPVSAITQKRAAV